MRHEYPRRPMPRVLIAVAATVTVMLSGASVHADEQNLLFLDFESTPTMSGTRASATPNEAGVLSNVDPVFMYTYSGQSNTFSRTEGIDNDGVGGSHAAFQSFDGTAAAGSFFYYIGIGRYVYIDPAVGGPFSTPDQLKWTFDTKGIGQTGDPPQATARFAIQTGTGDAYVAILPLAISSTYTTQGGTLDTFFPQDADPDYGGPLPAGPGTFSGKYSFIAQLDYGNGGFGFDAGNKLSIDNFKVSVVRPVYRGGATSSYTDAANWSEGVVPNSQTAFPQFGANSAVARTVTLNSAVTVNRLDFAGTIDDTTTITGTGSITLQGDSPGLIDHEGNDTLETVNVPVILAKSGTIRVNAGGGTVNLAGGLSGTGSINKDRNGRLLVSNMRLNGGLNVIGGTVELQAGIGNNSTSKITSLAISATEASANLQLNDARLIIDYTGTSPLAATVASFKAGDIVGTTATPTSQTVAIVERSALPVAFGNTFGGQSVDGTSLLVLLTLKGDANIDRTVGFDDLVIIAQNYNTATGATWDKGDFNYDGAVNFDDLVPLAQNYNGTFSAEQAALVGSDFASDFALAQSLAPEPTTLLALTGISMIGLRRRRQN